MAEYYENLTFVKRTKQLIKIYTGEFDATILVNCAIGLLFIAKEKYGDTLGLIKDPEIIRQWGIDIDKIECCKRYNSDTRKLENEPRTLRAICRHLRNSFAHCNFSPINKNRIVVGFKLKDFYNPCGSHESAKRTFQAEISVNNLRLFLNQVADYVLRKSKKVSIR